MFLIEIKYVSCKSFQHVMLFILSFLVSFIFSQHVIQVVLFFLSPSVAVVSSAVCLKASSADTRQPEACGRSFAFV